jgi:glycosyltransferase involved in cell wall biosynthesis
MKVLLLNQAFYPDVVSSAQHAGDLARELSAEGHQVTVLASRRAYDDRKVQFSAREEWHGVRVIRVAGTALGKSAKWRRAMDFGTYLVVCFIRLLSFPRFDVVVAMSSPPLLSVLAAAFVRLRGGRLFLWVMDLNPDEAVAAGWLGESSPITRVLEAFLRGSLRRADSIAVLDRFMLKRLLAKGVNEGKVRVIPPWAHNKAVFYDHNGRKAFREKHGLAGKYVVMYSGNHSPCHPLETLLRAAQRLVGSSQIVFCFAGGGSEFEKVQAFAKAEGLQNIVCVPYQPLGELSASLSAADLHVVVMGEPFVGIVHPCKIYNILTLGIPLLYIGPPQSYVVDILPPDAIGRWAYLARHGEVDNVSEQILAACGTGIGGHYTVETELGAKFAQDDLVPKIADFVLGSESWVQHEPSRVS